MNGRVYDPQLGRFLSADPYVNYPAGAQGLNRYSYTDNNPLSRVDPSGYGWLSKTWNKITGAVKKLVSNPIVQTIAAIVVAPWVGLYVGTTLGLSTAAGYAVSGFTAGFIASGGSLKAGLVGAATGLAFYGVGNLAEAGRWGLPRTALAHGTVGGASNMASGGKFKEGFMGGGFASFASPAIGTAPGGWVGRTVAAAVVGGTAAELGGGKFANGAVTGAFSRLYNHEAHEKRSVFGSPASIGEYADRMTATLRGLVDGAKSLFVGLGHAGRYAGRSVGLYGYDEAVAANREGLLIDRAIGEYVTNSDARAVVNGQITEALTNPSVVNSYSAGRVAGRFAAAIVVAPLGIVAGYGDISRAAENGRATMEDYTRALVYGSQ